MSIDVVDLRNFYGQRLGVVARRFIGRGIRSLWRDTVGQRVLGVGYATPYLGLFREEAERCLAFMPAGQGVVKWPTTRPALSALVDENELPLTDSAVDVIIAVHAFEHVADAEELMRELWRVAAPNARLILVVPRRRGIWAQLDNTPFGDGNPFSRSQVERLLRAHSFVPETWREALYLPPANHPLVLKFARFFERFLRLFGPTFAGVIVVSATKELFPAVPRRKRLERYIRVPSLAPQAATMALPER